MRSVAALNGNAVTESSGGGIVVGSDPEIHLADALARHLREGAEHATRAHGRLKFFISHLAVAAVAEFEEGLDRIAAGVAGIGREKQFEAAVGLITRKSVFQLVRPMALPISPLGRSTFFFTIGSPPPTGGRKLQAALACSGISSRSRTGRTAIDRIKPPMDWV